MPQIVGKNSNRGIGTGAAQIYNTGGNIQLFGQLMARKKAEEDAEKRQLAEHLASLKTDGLRDYDKDDYYKTYDQWRSKWQEAIGTKDKQTKFNLQAEASKLESQLNELVYKSKQGAAEDHVLALDMLKDPDKYSDEFKAAYQKSIKAPLSHPDRIKDYTQFPMERDLSKVPEKINKINTDLLTKAKEGNPRQIPFKGGNRTGTILQYDTVVDPQTQALAYAEMFDLDKDIKVAAKKSNPNLPWDTNPVGAKAQWVQDMVAQNPLAKQRSTAPILDTQPDNFYAHWNYQLGHPKAPSMILAGQPVSVSFPIGEDAKGNIKTDNFYPVNIANANFAGTKTYDLTTGKLGEDLPASADYGVVGVTKFPIIRKDSKLKLSGALAQPNFAKEHPELVEEKAFTVVQQTRNGRQITHLVPFELTPNNVKNTKAFQAAISGFNPNTPTAKPITPKTPTGKSLTGTSAQLAEAAKKKGMTKEQYKKALQAAGYTVTEK